MATLKLLKCARLFLELFRKGRNTEFKAQNLYMSDVLDVAQTFTVVRVK